MLRLFDGWIVIPTGSKGLEGVQKVVRLSLDMIAEIVLA